jgi:hypothetical protein
MQVNTLITSQELATLLEESNILDISDLPGIRMYTLEFNKPAQDILVFASTESAFVVYPCHQFDAESGGSIHDISRAIAADA